MVVVNADRDPRTGDSISAVAKNHDDPDSNRETCNFVFKFLDLGGKLYSTRFVSESEDPKEPTIELDSVLFQNVSKSARDDLEKRFGLSAGQLEEAGLRWVESEHAFALNCEGSFTPSDSVFVAVFAASAQIQTQSHLNLGSESDNLLVPSQFGNLLPDDESDNLMNPGEFKALGLAAPNNYPVDLLGLGTDDISPSAEDGEPALKKRKCESTTSGVVSDVPTGAGDSIESSISAESDGASSSAAEPRANRNETGNKRSASAVTGNTNNVMTTRSSVVNFVSVAALQERIAALLGAPKELVGLVEEHHDSRGQMYKSFQLTHDACKLQDFRKKFHHRLPFNADRCVPMLKSDHTFGGLLKDNDSAGPSVQGPSPSQGGPGRPTTVAYRAVL